MDSPEEQGGTSLRKPKLVKTDLDQQIAELASQTNQTILVTWACDCAERVLPYFETEYPADNRPRLALAAGRAWLATHQFKMADIRQASLAAHAAAREADEGSAALSAARAAGQAVAATHAAGHAIVAAIYAATAIRDGVIADDAAVMKERQWQYRHLLELRNKG